MIDFVKCGLCGLEFSKITNTHLKYKHGITIDDYLLKFPDAKTISDSSAEWTSRQISISRAGQTWNDESRRREWSLRRSGEGNPNFGHIGYRLRSNSRLGGVDWTRVGPMLSKGRTVEEISSELGVVEATLYSHMERDFPEVLPLLVARIVEGQVERRESLGSKISKRLRGRISPLKGRTYLEIFKSEEKASGRASITSEWMRTEKNIRRFARHPSRPQLELLDLVRVYYAEALSEYPVDLGEITIWLDVAVLGPKLDLEYDEPQWHLDTETDELRDQILEALGWRVLRIKGEGELTDENIRRWCLSKSTG